MFLLVMLFLFSGLLLTMGQANAQVRQVIVSNGEQAIKGTGWTNPTTNTIKPQTNETE